MDLLVVWLCKAYVVDHAFWAVKVQSRVLESVSFDQFRRNCL